MQELWPTPAPTIDIAARLAADERPKPVGRPWVTMVMIGSIDGAISVEGVSGGLGAPSDAKRFIAARRNADAIVVGASTVVAEDYQPVANTLAIVSGSLSPDPAARLFGDPERRPVIYTTDQAVQTRGTDFDGVAELVALGDSVEPVGVLADLDRRNIETVVLEGGPTLNGHFLRADLVDELLISVSPLVVGGDGVHMVRGPAMPSERRFSVDRVLFADDLIFVRYLRQR